MTDGFYRIAFTGHAGSGFGMVVFRNGIVVGADVAGATYDGTYAEDTHSGQIRIEVTTIAPAGITPVQTGIALTAEATYSITATIFQADLIEEHPVLLETPLGPVNVIFKKIRDLQ